MCYDCCDCVCLVVGDIDGQQTETSDIERSIRNMQNDMLKLNLLLTKEGKTREQLKQDNSFRKHMANVHGMGERCDVCNKLYRTKEVLEQHVRKAHGE